MPGCEIDGVTSGFELFSVKPLSFIWRNFASNDECRRLVGAGERLQSAVNQNDASPLCEQLRQFGIAEGQSFGFSSVCHCKFESRKLRACFDLQATTALESECAATLQRFEDVIADFLAAPPHTDEEGCVLNFTPGRSDGEVLENGLHVDTNRQPRRFATAILYLSSIPVVEGGPGGETIFPLGHHAHESAEAAGCSLLRDHGVEATCDVAPTADESVWRCVKQLETAAAMSLAREKTMGMAVKPEQGSMLLFFTRGPNGMVDPCSWHGSAAVPPGGCKWTLQTFKAVKPGQAVRWAQVMRKGFTLPLPIPVATSPEAQQELKLHHTAAALDGAASSMAHVRCCCSSCRDGGRRVCIYVGAW